jgi:hypothetical protein
MSGEHNDHPDPTLPLAEPAPGPSAPGRSSSSARELEQRIEFTAYLLGQMVPKGQVKTLLRRRYQNRSGKPISARTCEDYISRAREKLIEWTQKPKEEHVTEAAAYYVTTIQNAQATISEKLRARERLDALYGINAPIRHAHGGDPDAPPIQAVPEVREIVVTTREEARQVLAALSEAAGVSGQPGAA